MKTLTLTHVSIDGIRLHVTHIEPTLLRVRQNYIPRGAFSPRDVSGGRFVRHDAPPVKKHLHLTFDDGPNAISTPILLDALKKHNIRATFFVVGQNIDEVSPDILRRMIRDVSSLSFLSFSLSLSFHKPVCAHK